MKKDPFIYSGILFIITMLSVQPVIIRAGEGDPVSARIECGPWLQAVGETEFTVVWTTNVKAISWVEIAPDDGSHFYSTERRRCYESVYGRRPVTDLHTVRISGLQKGTTYRYRVYQQALLVDEGNKRMIFGEGYANDVNNQPGYKVTTLDESNPECRFAMVNDIHGNDSLFRALTRKLVPSGNDFVVFNGDMLTQIESTRQIADGYMRSAGKLFSAYLPLFTARGNHENRGSASYEYMNFFPTSTGKPYYTFRQGPAFFIVLDCGEDKPDSDIRYYGLSLTDRLREEQALWLNEVVDLEAFKSAPVKIVILHMPPAGDRNEWHGRKEISRLFMPVLNNAGIDLMLCGHLHKNVYTEKGKENNNFPILVNSNKTRVDAVAERNGISLSVTEASGKILHTYQIPCGH